MSLGRIGLILIAIVAAVAGVFALYRAFDERAAPPIVIEDAGAILPVVVEVRGAVARPGVYELTPGARMQEALGAAGGLSASADLSTINRARRLRDGEVIVIAVIPAAGGTPQIQIAGNEDLDENLSATININSATASELEALPGIGEVSAERIVEFRETNGPFRSVDDLVHVEGISARTIDGLRNLITTTP